MTYRDRYGLRDPAARVGFARPHACTQNLHTLRRLQIVMTAALAISTVVAVTAISIGFARAEDAPQAGAAVQALAETGGASAALGRLLPLLALIAGCTMIGVGLAVYVRTTRARRLRHKTKGGGRPRTKFI